MSTLDHSHLLIDNAAAAATQTVDDARSATQRGLNAVQDRGQRLLDQAHSVSDHTVTYIKGEPVKSMLIAAAAGAALMALVSLLTRERR